MRNFIYSQTSTEEIGEESKPESDTGDETTNIPEIVIEEQSDLQEMITVVAQRVDPSEVDTDTDSDDSDGPILYTDNEESDEEEPMPKSL